MIKETLAKDLNEQINAEYYSAYLYLALSAQANRSGFKGAANWLFVQAKEEIAHGTHLFQYLLDRSSIPCLADIKAPPPSPFRNLQDCFNKVLAHEQQVTERINALASSALRENDHAAYNVIMWYVNEQIEEESTVSDILSKIALAEGNPGSLFALDAELGARVFVDPFPAV